MFEKYTDRARRTLVLAQEEARALSHNYIGTEHILLGLIREGEGVAAQALKGLGLSLEDIHTQVVEIIGQGQQPPGGHIPFTPRAKKVTELSLREALQLGHNYVGTEHLLLGLVREGEGVAAQVLVKLGAELMQVRQEIIRLLSGYGLPSPEERVKSAENAYVVAQRQVADAAARLQAATQALDETRDPLLTVRKQPNRGRIAIRCEDEDTGERFWLEVVTQGYATRVQDPRIESEYPVVYSPDGAA